MKRKIIKQGISTLTISLPSKWVKQFNLEGGDEVEVIESDQNLIISTSQRIKAKSITLDITGLPDKIVWRYFTALYMSGYDEILIRFSEPKQFNLMQEIVDDHIGFAIVEQGSKSCVAKEVAQPQPDDFDKLFRRLFHMVTTASNDLLGAVIKNDYESMMIVHESDYNINKISGYCIRLLNKFGHPTAQNTMNLDDIARNLERFGDSYKHIAKAIAIKKAKLSKTTINLLKEVNNLVQAFLNLYFSFSKEQLVKNYEKKTQIHKLIGEQHNIQKGIDAVVLSELKRAVMITQEIAQSIMALNV